MAASSKSIVGFALLCAGSVLSSGCSLLNPLTRSAKEVTHLPAERTSQPRPPLAVQSNPLAIALETARLAEERGMDREAIAAYLEVRQRAPEHAGISHPLAVLYDRSGMTDAAAKEYAQALRENPKSADVHCDYGYFLYSTGEVVDAERVLRQAIQLDAGHQQAKVNLALVLGHQGKFDESESLFTEAIGPAAAKHNVGMLKLRAGDRAGAKQYLQEAAKRDPSIQEGKRVIAWLDASTVPNVAPVGGTLGNPALPTQ